MSNAKFVKFNEAIADGDVKWISGKIRAIAIDLNDCGASAGGWVVTAVTNTTNPTITTSAAHGLSVGDKVAIMKVLGSTGVNGVFTVATVPNSTSFTITLGSAPGAYTSGGFIANLSKQFLSDFAPSGARVSTSAELTNKTRTNGVLYGDSGESAGVIRFAAATGDPVEAVILVQSATVSGAADAADTAQRLIAFYGSLTGLPVTPNGGNIDWTVDTGANKLLAIG